MKFTAKDFGPEFTWGAATASCQIEGAWDEDGKSPSIWDTFSARKGKIRDNAHGKIACDFYRLYPSDISIVKELQLDAFRFSLAWTRILPGGTGHVNQKGLDFYKRVIDTCLEMGIQPWVTLYHWDLPQCLEDKGGWMNRDIVSWFGEYTDTCTRALGDRVNHWMVMIEPSIFTSVGHLVGLHAPGRWGWFTFLKASHHVAMSNAEGGRIAKANLPDAHIGTCFQITDVQGASNSEKDQKAALRLDAFINRLLLDPLLGRGYPVKDFRWLRFIESYIRDGDMEKLSFDFDFMGLQHYTRAVVAHKWWVPFIQLLEETPKKRGVENITEMGWEVYPEGIYHALKKLAAYENMPPIIITENGAATQETIQADGRVADLVRQQYLEAYICQVLRAKQEGVDVRGYFIWSLLDNFEWQEGYQPRFGLVRVDYYTLERTVKDSGLWVKVFLSDK
jgi:beta-glucosidase